MNKMNLFSIRIITNNVDKIAEFYEHVTEVPRTQHIDIFAEIYTKSAILAIGSPETLKAFDGVDHIVPEHNRSMILELRVKDVEEDYKRLMDYLQDNIVQKPKMMPWGNKSFLFKDPDGNLVNMFTPVSPEAIQRWGKDN